MALPKEGLLIQRLSDILAANKEEAISLFKDIVPEGEDLDTSASTTIGRLIGLTAPSIADLWETVGLVNDSFDPDAATGIALDKLVSLGGMTRFREASATCSALLTGDIGTSIPYASAIRATGTNLLWSTRTKCDLIARFSGVQIDVAIIGNSTNYTITYTTLDGSKVISYTSDASATETEISNGLIAASLLAPHSDYVTVVKVGTTQSLQIVYKNPFYFGVFETLPNLEIVKGIKAVQLQCQTTGVVTQEIGTITSIATPVLGWDSATNITEAVGGRALETDIELRLRFSLSKYEKATNILESLYSAILAVPNVTEVVIYENDTGSVDSLGLPAHCFMPIVLGGDTQAVAQVIWDNKPLGILSYMDATYPADYYKVPDSNGFLHPIGVSAPIPKPIYISLTISTVAGVYPTDGNTQMKAAISDYLKANFGIGDDITYSRLYTPVNSIAGHSVSSLTLGTSPSPAGTATVDIAFNEMYTLDLANIVITTI